MLRLYYFLLFLLLASLRDCSGFVERIYFGGECYESDLYLAAHYSFDQCACYLNGFEEECVKYNYHGDESVEEKKFSSLQECRVDGYFEKNVYFPQENTCTFVQDHDMSYSHSLLDGEEFMNELMIDEGMEVHVGFKDMNSCRRKGISGDETWFGVIYQRDEWKVVNFECPGYTCVEVGKSSFLQISCGYDWRDIKNHKNMVYKKAEMPSSPREEPYDRRITGYNRGFVQLYMIAAPFLSCVCYFVIFFSIICCAFCMMKQSRHDGRGGGHFGGGDGGLYPGFRRGDDGDDDEGGGGGGGGDHSTATATATTSGSSTDQLMDSIDVSDLDYISTSSNY